MATASKLSTYRSKRDFEKTREPAGTPRSAPPARSFVVQAHAARRMHYDLRLELDGVLVSWAVPKGPSLDPAARRLAVQTEDHPLEYGGFEGVIPAGEYGAGKVIVWDRGTWSAAGDPQAALETGRLRFELEGEKLHGRWNLIRTRGELGEKSEWLLIKSKDARARKGSGDAILVEAPASVVSGRTLERVDAASPPDPSAIEGAKPRKKILAIEPTLATSSAKVPEGDAWLHEIKLDGYRMLVRIEGGEVSLISRNGHDWTSRARAVAEAFETWSIDDAVIDGELVVLDARGISRFQALQNALSEKRDERLVFFAFDLLHLNGFDLRRAALVDRKRALAELLDAMGPGARVRLSEHTVGRGGEVFGHACELGLEGIVSKRAASPYREGRGRDWVKVKCHLRQQVVVGGWTELRGSGAGIGALMVGVRDVEGTLRYAGKVGTGFTSRTRVELHERLAPLEADAPPFVDPPRGAAARGAHWVAPELMAEIEATELTDDGKLRHASFKGLRTEEPAREIEPARPRLRLTHPDRVLYPEDGLTKRDLASYYARIAERMLPHIRERLVTLVRCPEGHEGECFYQRHATKGLPGAIRSMPVEDEGRARPYVYVTDAEGLVALVQMGVLEIHAWGSRIDAIETPDRLVFDLDPDPALAWERVASAAIEVRDLLSELGLSSFVRSTGGKGLHVVVPIAPHHEWDRVKEFCKAIAEELVKRSPRRYVAVSTKAKRTGRIYIDYLRNGRAATAVASYSTRAKAHAPIAVPLGWDALASREAPVLTVRDVDALLERDDPWGDFFEVHQSISDRALRQVGIAEE